MQQIELNQIELYHIISHERSILGYLMIPTHIIYLLYWIRNELHYITSDSTTEVKPILYRTFFVSNLHLSTYLYQFCRYCISTLPQSNLPPCN